MSAHTPTPWKARVIHLPNERAFVFIEAEDDEPSIAALTCEEWYLDEEKAEENAAFIVTACNAHEALVAAAKASEAYDAAMRYCGNDPEIMSSFCTEEGYDLYALYADWIEKNRVARAAAGVS